MMVSSLQERFGEQLYPSISAAPPEFEQARANLFSTEIVELNSVVGNAKIALDIFNSWVGYDVLYCSKAEAELILGRW